MAAEQTVRVQNPPLDPVYTVSTVNPSIKGVYLHSIANVPGTLAPQTFITIYNPIGSGKSLSLGTVAISSSNTMPSTETSPLRGYRISVAPTGGTLVAASTVQRFNTTQPNPVAEVRIDNPTVTLGGAVFSSPPLLDNRSSNVHTVDIPPGAGPFLMLPGEGLAIHKVAGTTSTVWNITPVWAEI